MNRRALPIAVTILAFAGSVLGPVQAVLAAVPDAVDDPGIVIQVNAPATSIDVLANDTAAPDATITDVTDPPHGTVEIASDGRSLAYTPAADYAGPDAFDYTVTDQDLSTDTATVTLVVNARPDAVADSATLDEDAGATAVDVLGNDTDAESATLTISGVTDGAKGTVAITGGGSGLTYTPAANANGSDTFTYTVDDGDGASDTATVDVTILAVNDDPSAGDDAVTVAEDQPGATSVDVLANDEDLENDPLTVTAKTNGAKGIVAITGGGSALTYRPNANASGADTFTYTVSDDNGGHVTAHVAVTITPQNDPPNAVSDGLQTPFVVYLNGGARAIPVLANDDAGINESDPLVIDSVTQGASGTVTITGAGTGLTYTPLGTATGIDQFSYTIRDPGGLMDTAIVRVNRVRDTTPPKAAILSIQKTAIPGKSGLRVYVKWSLTDSGSGLAGQLFQRRTGTGAWVTVALSSLTTRAISFGLPRGHTYTFRVRGTDRAGNVGVFASRQIRI